MSEDSISFCGGWRWTRWLLRASPQLWKDAAALTLNPDINHQHSQNKTKKTKKAKHKTTACIHILQSTFPEAFLFSLIVEVFGKDLNTCHDHLLRAAIRIVWDFDIIVVFFAYDSHFIWGLEQVCLLYILKMLLFGLRFLFYFSISILTLLFNIYIWSICSLQH